MVFLQLFQRKAQAMWLRLSSMKGIPPPQSQRLALSGRSILAFCLMSLTAGSARACLCWGSSRGVSLLKVGLRLPGQRAQGQGPCQGREACRCAHTWRVSLALMACCPSGLPVGCHGQSPQQARPSGYSWPGPTHSLSGDAALAPVSTGGCLWTPADWPASRSHHGPCPACYPQPHPGF